MFTQASLIETLYDLCVKTEEFKAFVKVLDSVTTDMFDGDSTSVELSIPPGIPSYLVLKTANKEFTKRNFLEFAIKTKKLRNGLNRTTLIITNSFPEMMRKHGVSL